ncbi:hypothetical protein P7C73_g4462, partial [Tremellales sp. Uapishka_1]
MSSHELIPLFPSATHPAIPIATRILSTLRLLTAPGKGNDLKPEERAALVGVSAMLGCEKMQSKDLPLSSAQKASSVSPAHFKSCLAHSRRILSAIDLDVSPSRKNKPSASTSTAPIPILSPVSTPKKKFQYSSGVDLSGLAGRSGSLKSTPAQSSPLKQSVTPYKEHEGAGEEEEEMQTPTKKVKYAVKAGVDLQAGPSTKRKREDTSAFLSLRPGSSRGNETSPTPGEKELMDMLRPKRKEREVGRAKKVRREQPRMDWTFREGIWGSTEVMASNREIIERIRQALPAYCASNSLPSPSGHTLRDDTLEEVMLNSWKERQASNELKDSNA